MSGISRSVARPVARPVSSPVAGGGGGGPVVPSFDADAADYFSRVAVLGGSFDQSALNATYTEAYVKAAINDFVVGCKADSVWSSITEMYLMAGVSFAGITAKLKYLSVPAVTNNNFVSGDYLAAGGGAGLKGDGSTKYLDTGIAPTAFATATSMSHGLYCTQSASGSSSQGNQQGTSKRASFDRPWGGAIDSDLYAISGGRSGGPGTVLTGAVVGSRTVGNHRLLVNGAVFSASTTTGGLVPDKSYALFAVTTDTTPSFHCNGRDTFAFLGQGLSDAEAIAFSARVNALMTALGSNVY